MAAQGHLVSCIGEGNCSQQHIKNVKEALIKWIASENIMPTAKDIVGWKKKRGFYCVVFKGTAGFNFSLPIPNKEIKTVYEKWHFNKWKIGQQNWTFIYIKKKQ